MICSRSESPRVQQILLHQKLKEEIEKNSSGKVRYVDSELYLRNNGRSPANSSGSEIQSATLNIGTEITKPRELSKVPETIDNSIEDNNKHERNSSNTEVVDSNDSNGHPQTGPKGNNNCQVCIIKGVRQDLMNFNKKVQEHNEQISKLKAKFLRSYFKRQMMD